jgi:glycosyltransferase involved in cell wall biosynthesis
MNDSLKILFLSNRGLLPIKDGHTRRSFNILKGLSEYNRIYFLSLYETHEEIDFENIRLLKNYCQNIEFYPSPKKNLSFQMISRLSISILSMQPYTIWRHYSASYEKRVQNLIKREKFDVVHCDILPISYAVKNARNVFCSLTNHDVSYLKCMRMAKESKNVLLKLFLYFEGIKLKRLEKNIYKNFDIGITVSEVDKRILSKLYPKGQFLVVENGIDVDMITPAYSSFAKNRIIWIGGFKEYSNKLAVYDLIKNIYPKIKHKIPSVTLDIIGGSITQRLKELAAYDSSINLLGYVDDPLPYLHKADVLVIPLKSGGGTKLKAIEAMAAGKAIVCTAVACEGINGIDGKHYIMAKNNDEFANSVIKLLKDENLKLSIGKNARSFVEEKFNYKKICKKLNDYYVVSAKQFKDFSNFK